MESSQRTTWPPDTKSSPQPASGNHATGDRPSKENKPPTGRWRRLMRRLMRTKRKRQASQYTQRWQVETVMSMIKRNLGEDLSGRSAHARNRQMRLMAITHNVMIVLLKRGFATEHA